MDKYNVITNIKKGIEWSPFSFGIIAILISIFGFLMFRYSDSARKVIIPNTIKINKETNERIYRFKNERSEIIARRIIKISGLVLIPIGLYLCWNAKKLFNLWFG